MVLLLHLFATVAFLKVLSFFIVDWVFNAVKHLAIHHFIILLLVWLCLKDFALLGCLKVFPTFKDGLSAFCLFDAKTYIFVQFYLIIFANTESANFTLSFLLFLQPLLIDFEVLSEIFFTKILNSLLYILFVWIYASFYLFYQLSIPFFRAKNRILGIRQH